MGSSWWSRRAEASDEPFEEWQCECILMIKMGLYRLPTFADGASESHGAQDPPGARDEMGPAYNEGGTGRDYEAAESAGVAQPEHLSPSSSRNF